MPARNNAKREEGETRPSQSLQAPSHSAADVQRIIDNFNRTLDMERHRYSSLKGQLRRERSEHGQLRDDYDNLAQDYEESKDNCAKAKTNYETVLEKVLIPWARHRNIDVSGRPREISISTMRRLLEDATRVDTSQVQVRIDRAARRHTSEIHGLSSTIGDIASPEISFA